MYKVKNRLSETQILYSGSQLSANQVPKGLISLNMLQPPFDNGADENVLDDDVFLSYLTSVNEEDIAGGFRFVLRDLSMQLGGDESEFNLSQALLGDIRGASRLLTSHGQASLNQECGLIKQIVETTTQAVEIIVPFVRTTSEAAGITDKLAEYGLCRGQAQLKISLLCQLPANLLVIESLCAYFDQVYFDIASLQNFYFGGNCQQLGISSFHPAMRELLQGCMQRLERTEKKVGVIVKDEREKWQNWLSDYPVEVIIADCPLYP